MIRLDFSKRVQGAQGPFDVRLDVALEAAQFTTLFGPSGSGKTTTLRCIAGLERPDRGRIEVDGEVWFDSERGIHRPPQHRGVGFVFQDYALFPHLNVRRNLEIALPTPSARQEVDHWLERTGTSGLAQHYPAALSGGQRQRVALARALVRRPRLLLLDEPLSALDRELRTGLQTELRHLQQGLGLSALLVSHDLSEVFRLSDRVLCMECGHITKAGTPREVFAAQAVSGKFQFVGEVLDIAPSDILMTLTVLVGSQVVQVVGTEEEVADIAVGDTVLLASKAFNPVILKLAHEAV